MPLAGQKIKPVNAASVHADGTIKHAWIALTGMFRGMRRLGRVVSYRMNRVAAEIGGMEGEKR
jgi:hypothetical protein